MLKTLVGKVYIVCRAGISEIALHSSFYIP